MQGNQNASNIDMDLRRDSLGNHVPDSASFGHVEEGVAGREGTVARLAAVAVRAACGNSVENREEDAQKEFFTNKPHTQLKRIIYKIAS